MMDAGSPVYMKVHNVVSPWSAIDLLIINPDWVREDHHVAVLWAKLECAG